MSDETTRLTFDSVVPMVGHERAILETRTASVAVACPTFEFQAEMPEPRCIGGTVGGSYPSQAEHEELLARSELGQARAEVLRLWAAGRSGPTERVAAVLTRGDATAWQLACGHVVAEPPRWYGGRPPETVPCVACGNRERGEGR